MLDVLITLTPGHRHKLIDCQNAKVHIVVLPIMDVKTRCNSKLEFLEHTYRFKEFTHEWLQNPKYCNYQPLFTTQNEWTIVRYVMEVLRLFRYWTLWMSKRHSVTLHHVITMFNEMIDLVNGMMWALAKRKTQWKEDLFFAVKWAWQKLSKFNAEVTPTTGIFFISANILDSFHKLQSYWKWEKWIDITAEDGTFYTTQCQEAFLKYVEHEY